MSVQELNRDQLTQLKQSYYCEMNVNVSWGELIAIDTLVGDEQVFEAFKDVDFVEDDFF